MKEPVKRDRNGKFAKGNKGGGRPKRDARLLDSMRDWTPEVMARLKGVINGEAVVNTAKDPKTGEVKAVGLAKPRVSDIIKAAEIWLAYAWGKPSQQIEVKQVNPLDQENHWILEVAEKPKDATSSTNGKANGHG